MRHCLQGKLEDVIRMRFITVGLLVLCSVCTIKAEDSQNTLYEKCTAYVQSFDPTEVEQTKLIRVLLDRAEQRALDKNSDAFQELDSILIDYLWDNKSKLEQRDRRFIFNLCVYYRYYVDKRLALPTIVTVSLTEKNVNELITWIDQQLAFVKE